MSHVNLVGEWNWRMEHVNLFKSFTKTIIWLLIRYLPALKEKCLQTSGNPDFWSEFRELGRATSLISNKEARKYGSAASVSEKRAEEVCGVIHKCSHLTIWFSSCSESMPSYGDILTTLQYPINNQQNAHNHKCPHATCCISLAPVCALIIYNPSIYKIEAVLSSIYWFLLSPLKWDTTMFGGYSKMGDPTSVAEVGRWDI